LPAVGFLQLICEIIKSFLLCSFYSQLKTFASGDDNVNNFLQIFLLLL